MVALVLTLLGEAASFSFPPAGNRLDKVRRRFSDGSVEEDVGPGCS